MATPNLGFQNFYTTTLSSGITATDTTIYLNSLPTPTEGYLVIEPDSSTNKEIIYYTSKGANFVTLPSIAAGRGVGATTAVSHNTGVTCQMNVVAEHFEALQDGTAFAIGGIGATPYADGWTPILGVTPNTVTANGNRNYDLVFNSVDLTSTLSPGMRLKATRTVAAPTQCTDLESGSSQYYSKASPAGFAGITNTVTMMAWIKLESYPPTVNGYGIVDRDSATGTLSGMSLIVDNTGRIVTFVRNATGNIVGTSYASIPIGRWIHVASTITASTGAVTIYFDGVAVSSSNSAAGTTIVQPTTSLFIGNRNSAPTVYFDGKIAQAAIFSSALSAATINGYISQGLSGSESTLVSAYSFNGVITDLNTTNANNLTANGSAVATNADSPFAGGLTAGLLEYAYITSVTFSTNTTVSVSAPAQYLLPTTGGVSAMSYSTHLSPFGWINGDYNPYKFHVYRSAALTPGASDIIWDTKSYDLNNNVDTTTGIYTAPVAGYYQFNATVMVNSVAANLGYGVGIKKNGVYQVQNTAVMMYAGAYNHGMSISVTLQLAVGDKVSVVEAGTSSRPLQTGLASGFSGSLISKG